MAVQHAQHYRFTVEQYQRLAEEGYIDPHARVELIDGEVVEMSPIGSRHNAVVDRVAQLLVLQLAGSFIVRTQGSIRLDDVRAPQPDFAVLRPQDDFYASGLPGPEDVLLLIEVADTSLVYDREEKAARYGWHGIPEYWIVDLIHDVVLVHTEPAASGYTRIEMRRQGESWSPHLLPDLTVTWEDIFG